MARKTATSDSVAEQTGALGRAVASALERSLNALSSADLTLADTVVRGDAQINSMRYAVEESVVAELAKGARPERLRYLVAVLSVINDLERMGDHAEGVAKVALMLGQDGEAGIPVGLLQLGEMVRAMLERGLEAFETRDADSARRICDEDDVVDELYDRVYAELLAAMDGRAARAVPTTYLLWVAHNLERVADRVTNVCERTVYLVTGRVEELNVSNY